MRVHSVRAVTNVGNGVAAVAAGGARRARRSRWHLRCFDPLCSSENVELPEAAQQPGPRGAPRRIQQALRVLRAPEPQADAHVQSPSRLQPVSGAVPAHVAGSVGVSLHGHQPQNQNPSEVCGRLCCLYQDFATAFQ